MVGPVPEAAHLKLAHTSARGLGPNKIFPNCFSLLLARAGATWFRNRGSGYKVRLVKHWQVTSFRIKSLKTVQTNRPEVRWPGGIGNNLLI